MRKSAWSTVRAARASAAGIGRYGRSDDSRPVRFLALATRSGAGRRRASVALRVDLGRVRLYWLESRPSESGRVVLVRSAGDAVEELSPGGVSIRSRVHEYGGGASCLVPEHGPGAFAYVRLDDQRVWLTDGGSAAPRALSSEPPAGEIWAHGGLCATPDGDWVVAVREAHRPGNSRPRHCLVAVGTRSTTWANRSWPRAMASTVPRG